MMCRIMVWMIAIFWLLAGIAQAETVPTSNQVTIKVTDSSGTVVYPGDASAGGLKTSLVTLLSGEDQANNLMAVNGGAVRSVTVMTGVTTNTTSSAVQIYSGGKTPIAQVSGTGAVAVNVSLYGDNDNDAANGILICTIALSATTIDVDVCTQFAADYAYYYAVTDSISGTGATVEFVVATGIAASGSGSGGDASAANQSTMITSLQLIDNVVGTEDAGETAGGGLSMSGTVRRDVAASSAGTTGDNATLNTDALGLAWVRHLDPCSGKAKTYANVDITTATTTEITPSLAGASTYYYICSIALVTAAANNVAIVDDDTDNCASVTSGMTGGLTAAEGWNFAANGGIALGNGMATVLKTPDANSVVCIVTSAATQLSGVISYVAAP